MTSKIAQVASMLGSPEFLQTQKQSMEQEMAFGAFLNNYAASTGGGQSDLFSGKAADSSVKPDTVKQTAYICPDFKTRLRLLDYIIKSL